MKMIGYARVSTDEQADSGVSLDAQCEKIRMYAKLHDIELVDVVIDGGFSGKSLNRPGIQKCLAMLKKREVGGIIIAKLDRLTRNARDMEDMIEEVFCGKLNAALCSVADSLDTTTSSGLMVIGIFMQVLQWERRAIGERTRDALRHKKAKGERVGSIPYGKKLAEDGASLVDDEDEIGTIKNMLWGKELGHSYRKIASDLNSHGVPTKHSGKVLKDGKVIQGKWTANRVMDVLKANQEVACSGV